VNYGCKILDGFKLNLNDFKPRFWIFSEIENWSKDLNHKNLDSKFGIFRNSIRR
jgi:hypothetical protein